MNPSGFLKYLRDAWCFVNEILASPKLRTDTLKNILKFLKSCQIFGKECPEIRVIGEKLTYILLSGIYFL